MDLEITVGGCSVSSNYNRNVVVQLEDIDKSDLNTKEVAECIDIETYIDAIGEDTLKEHIEKYYDWFPNQPS